MIALKSNMVWVISICLLALFIAASNPSKNKSERLVNDVDSSSSISYILTQWKKDSLGCKHVRSMSKMQVLIDSMEIHKEKPGNVEFLLGPANKIESNAGFYKLFYYINSFCITQNEMEITTDKMDRCWVEFIYKDTLKGSLIIEMCQ